MKCHRHPCLWLLPLASLLLAGCGGDKMSEMQSYAQRIKARAPGPIKPLPEIKPVETFVYKPDDRRDPFVPDEQAMPPEPVIDDNGLAPDPNRRKEELESFPLDSLRMVGTLDQGGTRWGLIRTQAGTIHSVKVGNYLGTNYGVITSIGDDAIQLTEIVSDAPGQWQERPAKVALSK